MLPLILISCLLFHQCASLDEPGSDNIVSPPEPKFTGSSNDLCGFNRASLSTLRIVGGRRAQVGQIPHQVSLQLRQSPGSHFCGGVIISDRWILTAAHCLVRRVDRKMAAIAGKSSSRYTRAMTFDIETAILHRDYNSRTAENDIALLKTTEAMPLLSKNTSSQLDVNNICLPGQDEQFEGKATISGFGRTSYLGSPSSQLLAAEVDLQPDANCAAHYNGDYKFKGATMVCAGDQDGGGRSSCHGDSGGPLYQTQNGCDVLIGVTSFGRGCGRNGAPTVYTRVSSYLNWINKQTAAN